MLINSKLDFLENINLLTKLAEKGSEVFPDELCRFLISDLNLNSVLIAKESEKNKYNLLNTFKFPHSELFKSGILINDYEKFLNHSNYERDFIGECTLSSIPENPVLQSLLIFVGDQQFILIIEHKSLVSEEEKNKIYEAARFVQNLLRIWLNIPGVNRLDTKISSTDFLLKFSNGLIKEIKTIGGLVTIIKEDQPSNTTNKLLDEIKNKYQSVLDTVEDLSLLLKLNSVKIDCEEESFSLENLFSDIINKVKNDFKNLEVELVNYYNHDILTTKQKFENIVFRALSFVADLSPTNSVKIHSSVEIEGKLKVSFSTEGLNLSEDKLANILMPFENKEFSKNKSGLALALISKEVEMLNGSFMVTQNSGKFNLNITINVQTNSETSLENILDNVKNDINDKILVIESDNASSSLLKNHLSKWHYKTEIVSSGSRALRLISENKYVAIILNIEQENENSLELLQKIKNNKSTRNIPVIVFSVETEKEKIYLMGSVEYLVKPINYNNLVEILTSYKLRRNSTVLCVDDDQPTLNLVNQAVITAGFNVISEYRPEFVMDLISDKELDLAIIDLDMPKINGFDLIKKIKSEDKFSKLPIIIYTGKEDYQEDLQKIDGMFVDLLDKKSTSFNELEKTITDMIKSYEEPKTIDEISEESSGPKILMAEDYKHSQIIVTRLLKKSGFENVIVVENGEEALNICECDKIDLILMDMQMPVMNGFEATGKIRELEGYADTPIIALTAFAMKGDREKCLEAGATDYIPKPIDSKEFIEKVKYYTQVKIVS